MVSGTIIQLVSYDSQDVPLTGNPEMTHFKSIYKQSTNFAIETIEELFINKPELSKTSTYTNTGTRRVSCSLSKKGDLIKDVILELDISRPVLQHTTILSDIFVKRPGLAFIESVELEIGGVIIDRLYGEWIDIYYQLSKSTDEYAKLSRLVDGSLVNNCNEDVVKLYIPIPFFFTKNIGLALPAVALEYNNIVIHVTFKNDLSIIKVNHYTDIVSKPTILNAKLLCDYIFLDIKEKRAFYTKPYEYIIEQIQFSGNNTYVSNVPVANINLVFHHPCKEIVWVCQDNVNVNIGSYNPFCYSGESNNKSADILVDVELYMNNVKRFQKRDSTYFRIVQSYQHHRGSLYNNQYNKEERGYIYGYSFSLYPDNCEPSGVCNFTRVSDCKLVCKINNKNIQGSHYSIRVYATNYNILKCSKGLGHLVYTH